MSYILDALKKADAERERGAVPGLHSQPLGQVQDDDGGDGRKPMSPAVWLGAGVGLCLIGVLCWQLLSAKKNEPVAASTVPSSEPSLSVPPASPAPPVSQTAEVPAGQSGTGEAQPAMRPEPQAPLTQTAPTQAPPSEMPPRRDGREPPARHGMPPPLPPTAGRGNEAGSATAASPSGHGAQSGMAAAPASATPRAAAGERVVTAAELPEDVRRALPQLTIGGAMYSETPSNRMLIVNSQVFHEGDQPYQGLVLEEIKLKSAIFRYRGYRYAVNY